MKTSYIPFIPFLCERLVLSRILKKTLQALFLFTLWEVKWTWCSHAKLLVFQPSLVFALCSTVFNWFRNGQSTDYCILYLSVFSLHIKIIRNSTGNFSKMALLHSHLIHLQTHKKLCLKDFHGKHFAYYMVNIVLCSE